MGPYRRKMGCYCQLTIKRKMKGVVLVIVLIALICNVNGVNLLRNLKKEQTSLEQCNELLQSSIPHQIINTVLHCCPFAQNISRMHIATAVNHSLNNPLLSLSGLGVAHAATSATSKVATSTTSTTSTTDDASTTTTATISESVAYTSVEQLTVSTDLVSLTTEVAAGLVSKSTSVMIAWQAAQASTQVVKEIHSLAGGEAGVTSGRTWVTSAVCLIIIIHHVLCYSLYD
jgi:hypothetical protein